MNRCISLGVRAAFVAGMVAWRLSPGTPIAVQAAGCSPVASPSAEVSPSSGFASPAAVVASFNNARQHEGCSTSLGINQSTYAGLSPAAQMFALFNAERVDRGLGALSLDANLLSRIDLTHSREMAQYGYFNHPSPINHPGPSHVFDRLLANAAISAHWSGLAENIAAGYTTAAAAVYGYMYQDSGEAWGHRHNILGYNGSSFGAYNWVGIGVATGGPYGTYYSSDFLGSSAYTPPGADTNAPTLSQPTVVSGSVSSGGAVGVKVTGASDTGAATGEAGLTGVVFYANSVTMDGSGNANTVVGTPGSAGTWTATMSVPANAVIHAVAVDGSGNYTDCAIGSNSCVAVNPPPVSQATLSLNVGSANPGASITASGSGFAPNETVKLYWNSTSGTPIATASSGSGTFSTSITVPSNATTGVAGAVIAVGQTAGDTANASIQVTTPQSSPAGATISIVPSSGKRGQIVAIHGAGFHPAESVLLRWNCGTATCTGASNLGYTRANTTGAISASIRVPYTSIRAYAVGALGYTSHLFATTTFTVNG